MLELSGGNYESPALMVGPDGVDTDMIANPREVCMCLGVGLGGCNMRVGERAH